jgi:hypothetical protein
MPEQIAASLAKSLRQSVANLLWKQWRAVGAMANADSPARTIVDPEALILMSFWMGEEEPRLFDVLRAWVDRHSALVSMQRLGNLREKFPSAVRDQVTALASYRVGERRDIRWKSLLRYETTRTIGRKGDKGRAGEIPFRQWSSLMLQLRQGMGIGVKADVLAFLLGPGTSLPEWESASAIASALSYGPTSVRRAADDLAEARFIRSLPTSQGARESQRMYCGDPGKWAQVLELSPYVPGWGFWTERYLFVIEAWTWLQALEAKPVSGYARDVKARELLTSHRFALTQTQMVDSAEYASSELSHAYLESALGKFQQWILNHA